MAESIKERTGALSNNTDAIELRKLLEAARTELVALRALTTELRTDHATMKTSYDAMETLIEELHDDHATNKTTIDEARTAILELIDDANTLVTWQTEMDGDADSINNYNDFLDETGVRAGDYTFAAQADPTALGAGVVQYKIDGVQYSASIAGNITLAQPSTNTIADTKFGAWRVLIDAAGAVTTQAANATTMQFADGTDALLNLGAIAQTASTACLGYITLQNTSGGANFTIGTTNTNTTATVALYYERIPRKQCAGLNAALGASLADDTGAATYAVGTMDVNVGGLKQTQLGAQATQAMDDADTIDTAKAGGWLVVTNLTTADIYALAADGVAGSVSAMAYASTAAVDTAIDTLTDNLPSVFCPVGKIVVDNASGGTFTAGTTNFDAASMTTVCTDTTVGTWDRTAKTGFDSHKINPPAVPATITAPFNATVSASDPTAGAATLTAPKPASGPATLTATAVSESLSA